MKFSSMPHLCTVCGKLRRTGYHDPCSKKLQASPACAKETRATKRLPPGAPDYFAKFARTQEAK